VNLAIMRRQGAGGLSVITMARETLGEQVRTTLSVAGIISRYVPWGRLVTRWGCRALPATERVACFTGEAAPQAPSSCQLCTVHPTKMPTVCMASQ
jgi:hypothetical protein